MNNEIIGYLFLFYIMIGLLMMFGALFGARKKPLSAEGWILFIGILWHIFMWPFVLGFNTTDGR